MIEEIYTRSRLRNNFCKDSTKENEKKFKIQRKKCVFLWKKKIKKFSKNTLKDGVVRNKKMLKQNKTFCYKLGSH